MLSKLHDVFAGGQCFLLTVKGVKPVHQKIDFVNKLCKQVCSTFFIVREVNKATAGYHFHAILKMPSKPKPGWFKKGLHMNLRKIGYCPSTPYTFSGQDFHESRDHDDVVAVMADVKVSEIIVNLEQKCERSVDVERVLQYLSKEMDSPVQYVDYIYSNRGVNQAVR